MGWKDLLQKPDERIVAPWIGGRTLRVGERAWTIEKLPQEHGWYLWSLANRKASKVEPADIPVDALRDRVRGFLVGDRLVPDGVRVDPDPAKISGCSERVHLIDAGLGRFARVCAGRMWDDGPLFYEQQEMPIGPEDEVLAAFLDEKKSVEGIKGVPPALDAAFRMETWVRAEAERRRREIEQRRREEEARRRAEEERADLVRRLGDAQTRRAMAKVDFAEAARAALAIGGAQYLDHKPHTRRGEMAVTFRVDGQRFICSCDAETLQIVDSGICLNDYDTGEKGDTWLTLESLPSVIREAIETGVLHIFWHA